MDVFKRQSFLIILNWLMYHQYSKNKISFNNKQNFHVFLFNSRNSSPEVRNIQPREVELNMILKSVNNFDIEQKMAWNICLILYLKHKTNNWLMLT